MTSSSFKAQENVPVRWASCEPTGHPSRKTWEYRTIISIANTKPMERIINQRRKPCRTLRQLQRCVNLWISGERKLLGTKTLIYLNTRRANAWWMLQHLLANRYPSNSRKSFRASMKVLQKTLQGTPNIWTQNRVTFTLQNRCVFSSSVS